MNHNAIPLNENQPGISHAEPVLAVTNVADSVKYWNEVLGFPNTWTFGGNPPNHGGVSWKGAGFIQFGLNPALANVSRGNSIWIRARNLQALYNLHQTNKASIVSPFEEKSWGFAEYTVEEINGYYIHFSAPAEDKALSEHHMPQSITIHPRKPTASEHHYLCSAVGWNDGKSVAEEPPGIYGVVAHDSVSGQVVGCCLLLGDNKDFFYIKDLLVHPAWQRKRVGTELMKSLIQWIHTYGPSNATVGLFTGDHLANFYRQFGFMQACGMYKQIIRK